MLHQALELKASTAPGVALCWYGMARFAFKQYRVRVHHIFDMRGLPKTQRLDG